MSASRIEYPNGLKDPVVIISGNIGENLEMYGIDPHPLKSLTINFEKMSYINSVGVKNWIEWVTRIPSHLKIYFDHCVPAIVNQINSVTGFLPKNGTVRSFYVPYSCDNCGREERILVQDGKEYEFGNSNKTLQIPDEIPCPKCKSSMEMDVLASRYFGFLKGS